MIKKHNELHRDQLHDLNPYCYDSEIDTYSI